MMMMMMGHKDVFCLQDRCARKVGDLAAESLCAAVGVRLRLALAIQVENKIIMRSTFSMG